MLKLPYTWHWHERFKKWFKTPQNRDWLGNTANPYFRCRNSECQWLQCGGVEYWNDVSKTLVLVRGLPLSTSAEISGFWTPSPLVRKITQPTLLISSTMSVFGHTPLPPLGAEVLNGSPLSLTGGGRGGQKMTKKVTCLISLVEMMTRGWGGIKNLGNWDDVICTWPLQNLFIWCPLKFLSINNKWCCNTFAD